MTERVTSNPNLEIGENADSDKKKRPRLRDALPLEPHSDSKLDSVAEKRDSEKKSNGLHEGTKKSSNTTDLPRSRSYLQHDERGKNVGQVGRNFSNRETSERGWWRDSKDKHSERVANKKGTSESQPRDRDEKNQSQGTVWRHDGFFEMVKNHSPPQPPPPPRRRPAFTEKKMPKEETENPDKTATEPPLKPTVLDSEKREERGGRNSYHLDRPQRPFALRNREADRYGGGGNYRGRDRFEQRYRSGGGRVEKWKHDLFDEANKSPTRKNEEDQIAKVEALLAS